MCQVSLVLLVLGNSLFLSLLHQTITTCYWLNLLNSSQVSLFDLPPPIKCRLSLFSTWTKVIFSQLFDKAYNMAPFQFIVHTAVWVIFSKCKYSHTWPLYKTLWCFPIAFSITIKILNIIFKSFYDLLWASHTEFPLGWI